MRDDMFVHYGAAESIAVEEVLPLWINYGRQELQ